MYGILDGMVLFRVTNRVLRLLFFNRHRWRRWWDRWRMLLVRDERRRTEFKLLNCMVVAQSEEGSSRSVDGEPMYGCQRWDGFKRDMLRPDVPSDGLAIASNDMLATTLETSGTIPRMKCFGIPIRVLDDAAILRPG